MTTEGNDRLEGVILGTLVGDALGLPREGMSMRRAARVFGGTPLRHRFLFGRGMMSDDTEHACLTAQAMLAHPDEPAAFAKSLAWKLRLWLLGLPAGVGFGTLRAILKLWVGFPPSKSGVKSAGNGPAMRSPLIGACFGADIRKLKKFVHASTLITHSDPKAFEGALAIALFVAYAVNRKAGEIEADDLLENITGNLTDRELIELLKKVGVGFASRASVANFAGELGLHKGISGYIVPVFFLDTNIDGNSDWDRTLTKYLYGGDNKYRLAQEIVLGIGGGRILEALGYKIIYEPNAKTYHSHNETLKQIYRRSYMEASARKILKFNKYTLFDILYDLVAGSLYDMLYVLYKRDNLKWFLFAPLRRIAMNYARLKTSRNVDKEGN